MTVRLTGDVGGAEPGRLRPPYPVEACANVACPWQGEPLGDEHGAYLYRDLVAGKLLVLCGDCARTAELLPAPRRFLLVAL